MCCSAALSAGPDLHALFAEVAGDGVSFDAVFGLECEQGHAPLVVAGDPSHVGYGHSALAHWAKLHAGFE